MAPPPPHQRPPPPRQAARVSCSDTAAARGDEHMNAEKRPPMTHGESRRDISANIIRAHPDHEIQFRSRMSAVYPVEACYTCVL